jgi:hypothetical protein
LLLGNGWLGLCYLHFRLRGSCLGLRYFGFGLWRGRFWLCDGLLSLCNDLGRRRGFLGRWGSLCSLSWSLFRWRCFR